MTWAMHINEIARYYGPVSFGEILGLLPDIIRPEDPRPAAAQITERYAHGGGYHPFGEGQWRWDKETGMLVYPGDPPMYPVAALALPHSDETVLLYPYGMVLIVGGDGIFHVTRMD